MKINGKAIAQRILDELALEVIKLKQKRGVIPTLAVILVGDNPASLTYIKQKQKATEVIGAKLKLSHQPPSIDPALLHSTIQQFNNDNNVHGLIVQRPVPKELGEVTEILNLVKPEKDVDGFLPNSPFEVPVAAAVGEILKNIKYQISNIKYENKEKEFLNWLRSKNIVVIGRGETAGAPIADYLNRLLATSSPDVATKSKGFTTSSKERRDNQRCKTSIIHSKTLHPQKIMKQADIIVACVGKERVVTKASLKPGVILIGVGIWRDNEGKLRGDYEEAEIAEIASFYTPTPGGVGPVNVACLMQNLVKATSLL